MIIALRMKRKFTMTLSDSDGSNAQTVVASQRPFEPDGTRADEYYQLTMIGAVDKNMTIDIELDDMLAIPEVFTKAFSEEH